MGNIEIIKRDGTIIRCFNIEPFCNPTQAVQETTLMNDDTVKITLRSSQPYKFDKGDKVVVNGYTYKIRTTAERTLQSDGDYIHTLTFYGVMYDLMKCQYRNCDADGNSTKSIFDLTYSIKDFVKVAIYNLERDHPGEWEFDEENCPDTEPITVSFSKNNVLQVIQDLCSKEKFNLEFRITTEYGVNTIHIGTFGSVVTPPSGEEYFEWGKGNGLWQLKETKVDDKAIITRLWAEGGSQNIKSGYRDYSDRLQLPYPRRTNTRAHTLKDGTVIPAGSQTIGISDDAERYIEDTAMSQAIGVEEDTQTFDEIYPRRTGTVTALGGSVLEFIDNTMDFDLNEKDSSGNTKYLIAGTSAKITFITGKLAGQMFEISHYSHTSKTFKIIAFTDERGLTIPTEDTEAFRFSVGDRYKLTDINMPESYVQNAEEDLWYAALEYFNEAKQARCQYELTFDREYFLENMPEDSDSVLFKVGDYVPIKDTRFDVEKNIRIQRVRRNLLLDHDYSLTLSDTTAISVVAQAVLDVREHTKIIQANDLRNLNKAQRGWRTTEELRTMIYDPDGYFDTGNVRPNSIDTYMLTVGSKSQQFVLSGVVLAANVGGDPNEFVASSGVLSHLTILEDGIRTWNMSGLEVTLDEPGGYYVFAKCSKTGSTGVWYVTQDQLKVEPADDPNNYYFQVGIIGSLAEGGTFRDFTTTYGFTRINGNTITTGRIVTSDGDSYLDLDGNKFKIGSSSRSVSYNEDGNGKVVLKNVDVVSGAGDPVALGVPRGTYSNSYTYYPNDTVQYAQGTSIATYRYIYPTPSSGNLPTDGTYWAIDAKGANGTDGSSGEAGSYFEYRFAKNGSRTTAPALDRTSQNPTGWSTVPPTISAMEYLWQTVCQKSALGQQAIFHIPVNSGESETLEDVTGNGNDVTLEEGSSVETIDGMVALYMPGNALATMERALPFGTNFTLCFWLHTDQTYIEWTVNQNEHNEIAGSVVLDSGTWVHMAFRVSGKSLTIFKDGVIAAQNVLDENAYNLYISDKIEDGASIYLSDIWCMTGALADNDIVRIMNNEVDSLLSFWSMPVRVTPYDGVDGKSPALAYRGTWSSSKTYKGTDVIVEAVKYNGNYYVAMVDAGTIPVGTLPTNTTYWNNFGAQFESVATELLLAEYANIGNLVLHNNCIMSTKGTINGVESDDYTNPNFVPNIIIDGQNGNSVISGSLRNPFTLFRKYQFKASDNSRTYYRYSNGDANGKYAWVFYTTTGLLDVVYTTTETPYNGAAYYTSAYTTTQAGVCLECKAVNVFSGDVSDGLSRSDNVVMPYSASSDMVLTSDEFSWTPDNSGRLIRLVNYKWGSSIASKYVYLSAPDGKYFYENGKQFSRIRLSRETVELLGYGTPTVLYGWIVVNRVDTLTEGTYGSPLKVICQGIFNPSSTYLVDKVWTSDQDVDGYDDDWEVQIITNGHYKIWIPFNIPVDEWHVMLTPCSVGSDGSRITYGNIGSGCCYACLYAKGIDSSKGMAYFEVKTADDSSLNDCGFLFQVIPTKNWAKPGDKTKSGVSQIERTSTGFHNVTAIREI